MAPNFVQRLLQVPRNDSRSKASHVRGKARRWLRAGRSATVLQLAPLSVHAWLRWILARDIGSEEEAGIKDEFPPPVVTC